MRILFAGTPEVAVPALNALVNSPHNIVGVLTRQDAPTGRGRKLVPSPVKARAEELGLPILTMKPHGTEFEAAFAELAPDVVAVVAYGEILRQEVLDLPENGWINLHFSLLPAWRGAAPVQRAIIAGDEITGATTFLIEAGLDSGPVLGIGTQSISPRDTAGDLLAVLGESGSQLLVATMDAIESGAAYPVRQELEGISHAAKLTVAEGEVDWTAPAQHIDRLIRGFTPAPGAWTSLPNGERLGLGPVLPLGIDVDDPEQWQGFTPAGALVPGQLAVSKKAVRVATGSAVVQLSTVSPQGKKTMSAADWARGSRLEPGVILGHVDGSTSEVAKEVN